MVLIEGGGPGVRLQLLMLADLRTMMRDRKSPMMESADIVRELLKLDTSPWSELRGGKGISTHCVARLLKPFGIRPKQFRDGVRAGQSGYTKATSSAWPPATSPRRKRTRREPRAAPSAPEATSPTTMPQRSSCSWS